MAGLAGMGSGPLALPGRRLGGTRAELRALPGQESAFSSQHRRTVASEPSGRLPIVQACNPQAPEVADHGLLEKLENDEEEEDRSSNIQHCTASMAPGSIPLVTRCRPSRPE